MEAGSCLSGVGVGGGDWGEKEMEDWGRKR